MSKHLRSLQEHHSMPEDSMGRQ